MAAVNPENLREILRRLVGFTPGESTATIVSLGGKLVLDIAPLGHRIPVRHLPGAGKGWTLLVGPDGAEAAIAKGQAKGAGSVLALDVFQTGAASSARIVRGDHLVFHQSDDANRVLDILHAIEYTASLAEGPVSLHCLGRAAFWCATAAAASERPLALSIDALDAVKSDEDLQKVLFIPGLLRAGGLRTIQRLTGMPQEPQPLSALGVN